MKQSLLFFACLVSVAVFASCNRTGLIEKVPVALERPQKVFQLEADASFQLELPEALNPVALQIVDDSILVIQNQPSEALSQHFCAYSIRSNHLLGTFLTNGRGPGEILQPHIEVNSADDHYLSIEVNSMGYVWQVDVLKSIQEGTGVFVKSSIMPEFALSMLPVTESLQVAYIYGRDICFQVLNQDGIAQQSYFPYGNLDGERYLTHLSSILASNAINGKVAEFMLCFPELHILDINTGTWRVVAVDDSWHSWKTLLNEPFSMDKKQFYAGVTTFGDYLLASYWGCSLGECMSGGHGGSIHVFDWNGNFLYCLNVKEDIESITFDQGRKHLYGLERTSGRVIRYDLSAIL